MGVKTVNGETLNIATLVVIGLWVITLVVLPGLYLLGKRSVRFDHLDRQIERPIAKNAKMREEDRGNNQQLLQLLANHTHDPATGFAISHIPPGTENPAG